MGSPGAQPSRLTGAPLTRDDVYELLNIVGALEGMGARGAALVPVNDRRNLVRDLKGLNAEFHKAGKTVQPTMDAFKAAASNADWTHAPGYYLILTDQPGDKSWPIVASTFILMHKEPADKAASAEAVKFFGFAFDKGDKMAEDLDYIPMPDSVIKLIEKTWSSDIRS